ncbi:unnamed protein product [Cuscuta epithymum]|uniref:YTH domain-containing family protein n=2 Tax=Cuscuta epithymum TaxID=186058 RepID=A0AAV0F5D3_9ASTE|nr:unnamed protein product [Cuscuta epithymum]
MAGEKILDKSEASRAGLNPESVTELTNKVSRKVGKASGPPSSISPMGTAAARVNGGVHQSTSLKPSITNSTAGSYDHYGGYSRPLNDDQGYFNAGIQSNNGSSLYYHPGSNPYGNNFVDCDRKHQPHSSSSSSSGYLQQQWCSSRNSKTRTVDMNGSLKSNGFNSSESNLGSSTRKMPSSFSSESQYSTASSKYPLQSHPNKQSNKFGSNFQLGGQSDGFHRVAKFPSYTNQNKGFMHHGLNNYRTNGTALNVNFKPNFRENFYKNRVGDASAELNRGPRANGKSNPLKPSDKNETIQRSMYNKADFQTQYDHAKFYVIKSFSEDNVHKCVKYDVWSSTPNGNKKLDNAFLEAERKASETGGMCPIFLFFSVNGSGQFLGVAEMIGPVDFNKKLDFWQLDKWTGFFPVKWHIIKDVPNNQLKHIILKNNDNKDVTYTRDTQEVGLEEGLEMLNIFKSYSEKSSLLDDFDFYEDREKSLKAKRRSTTSEQGADQFQDNDVHIPFRGENSITEDAVLESVTAPSLITQTRKLSLKSQPL